MEQIDHDYGFVISWMHCLMELKSEWKQKLDFLHEFGHPWGFRAVPIGVLLH